MCDGGKVLHRLRQAEVTVQLPAELIHQQKHIVPPLRQGRDDHRQGVQPVIEVPGGKVPSRTFRSSASLVAATMRTSTWMMRLPPTR